MSNKSKTSVDLDLSKIKNGALKEQIDAEISKVANNILDPNTDFRKKRKVQITLTFASNEERDTVSTDIQVKSVLAPRNPVGTTVLIGRDMNTGYVAVNELRSGAKGQTYIDPDDGVQKTDTGKPVDEVENDKPIDLRVIKDAKEGK